MFEVILKHITLWQAWNDKKRTVSENCNICVTVGKLLNFSVMRIK